MTKWVCKLCSGIIQVLRELIRTMALIAGELVRVAHLNQIPEAALNNINT